MRSVSAAEARRRFGDLVEELRGAATCDVTDDRSFLIEEDGEPVGLVLARDSVLDFFAQQKEWLRAALAEAEADVEAGRVVELTDDLLDEIHRRGMERLTAEGKLPRDAA